MQGWIPKYSIYTVSHPIPFLINEQVIRHNEQALLYHVLLNCPVFTSSLAKSEAAGSRLCFDRVILEPRSSMV